MDWKIIDTAPKDGTKVLVYQPKYFIYDDYAIDPVIAVCEWSVFCNLWRVSNISGNDFESDIDSQKVTHWMPLPEPPDKIGKLIE